MLGKNAAILRLYLLTLLVVALLVTACGSEPTDPVPTASPTEASTATAAPSPTEEPDEDGGVMRTVRSAPGKVWDGIKWVWDRGSDGVNTVWDGIRSGGGFLWDNVTSLPSTTWEWIKDVFRDRVEGPIIKGKDRAIELLKSMNPVELLEKLLIGFLKVVGMIAVVVLVLFGVIRWRLWMHVVRLFWGGAEKGLSRIPIPGPGAKKPQVVKTVTPKPQSPNRKPVAEREPDRDQVRTASSGSNEFAGNTWSRSQIRELRHLVTNQTIIVLFGRASRSDGVPVTDLELMRATGRSRAQIRTDFTGFARTCRVVNPEGLPPIETVEATTDGSNEAYNVPDQYLEWWFED